MTIADVLYTLALVLLFGTEIIMVVSQKDWAKHQTASHKVIAWIQGNPKKRRVFVAVGLVWLLYHWVFQPF